MKILSLMCFGTVLFLISSCKKDYTCTCEKKTTATGIALPSTSYSIKQTEKRAKEQCPFTSDIPSTETWTCTLK